MKPTTISIGISDISSWPGDPSQWVVYAHAMRGTWIGSARRPLSDMPTELHKANHEMFLAHPWGAALAEDAKRNLDETITAALKEAQEAAS